MICKEFGYKKYQFENETDFNCAINLWDEVWNAFVFNVNHTFEQLLDDENIKFHCSPIT